MDAKAKVVLYKTLGGADITACEAKQLGANGFRVVGYIPLTDHEAAMAELLAENARLVQVNEEAIRDLGNSLRERDALLTGLEALAGEWKSEVREVGYSRARRATAAGHYEQLRDLISTYRTLTNSAKAST